LFRSSNQNKLMLSTRVYLIELKPNISYVYLRKTLDLKANPCKVSSFILLVSPQGRQKPSLCSFLINDGQYILSRIESFIKLCSAFKHGIQVPHAVYAYVKEIDSYLVCKPSNQMLKKNIKVAGQFGKWVSDAPGNELEGETCFNLGGEAL